MPLNFGLAAEIARARRTGRRDGNGRSRCRPRALSRTLREALGGSSGPPYVFFLRAAKELEHRNTDERPEAQWARAFLADCQSMSDLGGAKKGDRTMLMPCGLQPKRSRAL
jgi:hypothetical protein